MSLNCNRCYICDQPIKNLSIRHFESKNCIRKYRQAKKDAQQYEGAFGVYEDLTWYIILFINYYGIDAKVRTKDFNANYRLMMEWIQFSQCEQTKMLQ